MGSVGTLLSVLVPLFAGFLIKLPLPWLRVVDRLVVVVINIILLLIGVSLSRVEDLAGQMQTMLGAVLLLFVCVIGANLLVLMAFDRRFPWQAERTEKRASVSWSGSMRQLAYVAAGFGLGRLLSAVWLPSENLGTYFLMLLILLVGVQLGSNGVKLRQVLVNRRGVQTALLFMVSALMGGLVFAWLMPDVSMSKGLALSSGFGWYSLSAIVMTEAYGPVWGSVALLNDLGREFFALVFIPLLMRRHPSAAVGVGGATSLDFTLPIIQSSGGLQVVPIAISFGFIVNVLSPILMVVFSTFEF